MSAKKTLQIHPGVQLLCSASEQMGRPLGKLFVIERFLDLTTEALMEREPLVDREDQSRFFEGLADIVQDLRYEFDAIREHDYYTDQLREWEDEQRKQAEAAMAKPATAAAKA
jgi:hypothetical protein